MSCRESHSTATRPGRWGAAGVRVVGVLLALLTAGTLRLAAAALPEPGWVVHGTIAGLVATNRPEVLLRATRAGETVTIPLKLFLRDGVPQCLGEVPMETRLAGDASSPGRLPLGSDVAGLEWSLRVNGVDLPLAAAGGTVSFGPADRGRIDAVRANFALRAPADTFATWSQRIFGRLVTINGDEDGDGRSNEAEFFAGANPLDPNSFPVNQPPVASLATNRFLVNEGTLLTVTNAVADTDVPAQKLIWRMVSGPAGAELNATNGVWRWTPGEAQGPSTNSVVMAVDDDGVPPLSATNQFTVIVSEVNVAPVFVWLTNATVPELAGYTQGLAGSDGDIPVQTLSFRLISGPAGAVVTNGVFAWTPSEAQGPSTNEVRMVVSDGVTSTTNTFTVEVSEVNQLPTLVAPPDAFAEVGTLLEAQFVGADGDVPSQRLNYDLVNGPAGSVVEPLTGLLKWTPTPADASSTNTITVRVRDGSGEWFASFRVIVRSPVGPLVLRIAPEGGTLVLRWPLAIGAVSVERSSNPAGGWLPLPGAPASEGPDAVVRLPAAEQWQFYRLNRP